MSGQTGTHRYRVANGGYDKQPKSHRQWARIVFVEHVPIMCGSARGIMKINAYVCLGDPAWIEPSIASYYEYVDKIIASYDVNGVSWSGTKLPVDECIRRLSAIDKDSKVVFLPGNFAQPEDIDSPVDRETHQRQVSLDIASEDADWVLQLDTDEVLQSWECLFGEIERAENFGCSAVYFPAIYIYQVLSSWLALEQCRRFGKRQCGYPGPIAVRSKTMLYYTRRANVRTLHVRCKGTYDTVIELEVASEVSYVSINDALIHFTRARTPDSLVRKFDSWGHSLDRNWTPTKIFWSRVHRWPYLFVVLSHFLRGPHVAQLKFMRLSSVIRDRTVLSDRYGNLKAE
jgi:hypothetical protein